MREIKFRGKRLDNGEWAYGFYYAIGEHHYIHSVRKLFGESWESNTYQVDPETVGQFTGFIDINGIESYENDIVKDGTGKVFVIRRIGGTGTQPHGFGNFTQFQCCTPCKDEKWEITPKVTFSGMRIIGNVHSSPELVVTP
jgi:uncharacterized phage protein (TIGR01671 family)